MNHATEKILNALKNKGYRFTKARECVVDTLVKSNRPLSIQEIVASVKVDEVSVYRIIALLLSTSLIEELNLSGGPNKYAISHGHHHHVVCTNCNLIVHLDSDNEPHTPKNIPGFTKIDDHELTYFGLCTKCY